MKKIGNWSINYFHKRGFVLLILIFAAVFIVPSCNRKVGVKPGGTQKTDKTKCKCKKKKGGVFSYSSFKESTPFKSDIIVDIEIFTVQI